MARDNTKHLQTYLQKFKVQVCDRAAEVDPSDEYDWFALSLGFFIALGLTLDDANALAIEARYDHHYWHDKEVT